MPYSKLSNIQDMNNCYLSQPKCKIHSMPMLPTNNGIYDLNKDTNNPLNCIN